MNKFKSLVVTMAVFMAVALGSTAMADSTTVLPQGRSSISLTYMNSNVTREFDDAGQDRELGYYFNHVDVTIIGEPAFNEILNQILFGYNAAVDPDLPYIDEATYDSTDKAVMYADARVDLEVAAFSYSFGLTDKWTMGVGFPYFLKARSKVDYSGILWTSPTFAADPRNPVWMSQLAPYQIGPNAFDLTFKVNDVLNQIGYDDLESWNGDPGIGDIKLVSKYKFLDTEMFDGAGGVWVTFPTGEDDDHRNLTDVRYGQGHYDTALFAMMDISPVEPVTWNLTGRYIWNFPYERDLFILDRNNPVFYEAELPTLEVSGDYHRGDYYELETELTYDVVPGFGVFGGYFYKQSEHSTIDDDLIPKSIVIEKTVWAGVSASTVEGFMADKAGLPMIVDIYHMAVQDGKNTEKYDRTFVTLTLLF